MRETKFIQQNKDKWIDFEKELEKTPKDPDKLSTLFVQITDDLSYARTFYPNRSVRIYLNKIAQGVFQSIYKNRTSKRKRFVFFWKEELPQLIYQARYELLLSLVIFLIAVLIGVISSKYNPDFSRQILGHSYVQMTKENIKSGDPMAVYKQRGQGEMFLGITFNNVLVAFRTFIMGLFYAVGTVSVLIYNGIMVGCFQYFFYEHGLFVKSFLSIWLHGTLEISSIIIAGGAGLTLGKGLVFPGTYSRVQALRLSAQRGFKIMLGIVPILLFAAFIESFITRYTGVPDAVKLALIIVSAAFIGAYFIWYPHMKNKKGFLPPYDNSRQVAATAAKIDLGKIKTNGEIIKDIFLVYKSTIKVIFRISVLASLITAVITSLFCAEQITYGFSIHVYEPSLLLANGLRYIGDVRQYFDYSRFPLLAIVNLIQFSFTASLVLSLFKNKIDGTSGKLTYKHILKNSYKPVLTGLIITSVLFSNGLLPVWALLLVQPFLLMFTVLMYYEKSLGQSYFTAFRFSFGAFRQSFGIYFILLLLGVLLLFLFSSPYIIWAVFEFINWNFVFEQEAYWQFFVGFFTLTSYVALHLCLATLLIGYQLLYFSLKEVNGAVNLKKEIINMGQAGSKLV